MKTKDIISIIDLLNERLQEDYDDISLHDDDEPEYGVYYDEIERLEKATKTLRKEIEPQPCELIDIDMETREAHVIGYFEENQNEDGPHPYRYVEVCGCFMPYKKLAKANLADVEAECKQYIYEEKVDFQECIKDRIPVTYEQFKSGSLLFGQYVVFWCDNED